MGTGNWVMFGAGLAAAVVAVVLAARWRSERTTLLALPVVEAISTSSTPTLAVVHGWARGEVVASPWTQREGLLFQADEVSEHQRRRSDGSTDLDRRSHFLGRHFTTVGLGGEAGDMTIRLDIDDSVRLRHLSMMRTGRSGASGLNLSISGLDLGAGSRSYIEEVAVMPGDELWVVGTVTPDAHRIPVLTDERLLISGRDPQSMGRVLARNAMIAVGVAVAGLVLAAVGLLVPLGA